MTTTDSIYTIGYEGVTQDVFIHALKRNGIETLIDVRAVPLSRKPGFSKNRLADALKKEGIAYLGLKGLGTPASGREAARKGRMEELRSIFAAHMKTTMAVDDLARAIDAARHGRSCLLCFEHQPACCHRSMVAEAMHEHAGFTIEHLNPMIDFLS